MSPGGRATDAFDLAATLRALSDSKHLVRERALNSFRKFAEEAGANPGCTGKFTPSAQEDLLLASREVIRQMDDPSTPWEGIQGGLLASAALYKSIPDHSGSQDSPLNMRDACESNLTSSRAAFGMAALQRCRINLEHGEVRVRQAVAELLGVLTAPPLGLHVWRKVGEEILESIERNIDRQDIAPSILGTSKSVAEPNGLEVIQNIANEPPEGVPEREGASNMQDAGEPGPQGLTLGQASGDSDIFGAKALLQMQDAGATDLDGDTWDTLLGGGMGPSDINGDRPWSAAMLHDTEGWRALDTSFRCLLSIMQGLGGVFASCINARLTSLVAKALQHTNRYVRETAFYVLGTVCDVLGSEWAARGPSTGAQDLGRPREDTHEDEEKRQRHLIFAAADVKLGLADNWSQVRYASSVACRQVLRHASNKEKNDILYPVLLPAMALNRHYVAAGVRNYSQETWQHEMPVGKGAATVARLVDQMVLFYVEQSEADNHAVREAACACMTELMTHVSRDVVEPHVDQLMRSLAICFRDASWPVRDAACEALGGAVLAFPEVLAGISGGDLLDDLYELWFDHLWDNIWSVRENSAIALGKCIDAYGEPAFAKIIVRLDTYLPKVREQSVDSERFSTLDPGGTTFGVAGPRGGILVRPPPKTFVDQFLNLDVVDRAVGGGLQVDDQQMFSCGSLAPKLQRGGGCMDHGFTRPRQPWEASDGAVYLLRELARRYPNEASERLPLLAELATTKNFRHYHTLHETVWKQLMSIAKYIGKQTFKRQLELFLDPLCSSLNAGHMGEEAAAGFFVSELMQFIGPNIFIGRLTDEQAAVIKSSRNVQSDFGTTPHMPMAPRVS